MRFNLDTCAIITFISNLTHKYEGKLNNLRRWNLFPFEDKKFVVSRTIYNETINIIKYGHPLEQYRFYNYLNLEIVPDIDNENIPLSRKISSADRIFISTGEALGFRSITADKKLVYALHRLNIHPNVIIILPEPLSKNGDL